eukprot:gnl/TRDRNA2_/TRDRNA2_58306_c1_seq1.p2 gnl/TRDRNA2_/TRDRNA2_58306_c1~~gnl/TRDRNA2_/TRDRNA2_58306_c1_seq1.p2  ORF type:complete len:101 (-),score=9.66 gnl/TRDRNA2_/TRDRNA2_58306_c1_seq1:169-471(-)
MSDDHFIAHSGANELSKGLFCHRLPVLLVELRIQERGQLLPKQFFVLLLSECFLGLPCREKSRQPWTHRQTHYNSGYVSKLQLQIQVERKRRATHGLYQF